MITLECNTDTDPRGRDMAFVARWQDDTFRYHVWIGIRPDIAGETPPYPVKIGETIYKNTIEETRFANTKQLNIGAAVHAKLRAELKREAKYEVLMALYHERRAAHQAFDAMHAEADRLNAIFNAWKLLCTATVDEKMTVGLI